MDHLSENNDTRKIENEKIFLMRKIDEVKQTFENNIQFYEYEEMLRKAIVWKNIFIKLKGRTKELINIISLIPEIEWGFFLRNSYNLYLMGI
jgi:hypothetical protein